MIHIKEFSFNTFQTRCCVVWDEDGICAFVDPGFSDASERTELVSFVESKGLKPSCIMLTHAHFDHTYGVADLARTYGIPVYMDRKETFTIENTNPYVCGAYGLPLPEAFEAQDFPGEGARSGEGRSGAAAGGAASCDGGCSGADISGGFSGGEGRSGAASGGFSGGEGARSGEDASGGFSGGAAVRVGSLLFEVLETPGHSVGGVCLLERGEKVLFSGDTLFAGAIGRTDHPGGDYDLLMKSIFTQLMALDGDTVVIPGHGPVSDIATERMTNPFLLPFNEPYTD